MKWAYPQADSFTSLPPYSHDVLNGDLALRGKWIWAATAAGDKEMRNNRQTTRKGSTPIKVYCLPEEKALVSENAKAAGLSASTFLLHLGAGYDVRTVLDYQRIDDLAKINADLGRLGGLLKLWLTNDERIMQFRPLQLRKIILKVLSKIEGNQDALRKVIETIVPDTN